MKKLFMYLFTLIALFVLFTITSCKRKEHSTQLSQLQLDLLETPKGRSIVTFNENDLLINHTISDSRITKRQTQYSKGAQFTPSVTYNNEYGEAYYMVIGGKSRIYVYAESEDPYRTTEYPAYQYVQIYNDLASYEASVYRIDFNNTLPFRTIHGITYSDVVLGVDRYHNDTLFWKQGIGILGWKRASQNYTNYRVF